MEKNIVTDVVIPASVSLVDKEGYAVDVAGVLLTAVGAGCFGIVRTGDVALRPAEVIVSGRCSALVNGAASNIAAGDALTGGSAGRLHKATIGTHAVRGIALEAATTDGALIGVMLY